jgi:hypothetical protein
MAEYFDIYIYIYLFLTLEDMSELRRYEIRLKWKSLVDCVVF